MKTPFGGPTSERARAQKPVETLQMVAFTVAGGEYALDIMRIKEIINPVRITSVPKAPAFIEGVIELRGAILPVVDLRRRFDLPTPALARQAKFLVVAIDVPTSEGIRRMIVALIVDGVLEPLRVAREQLRPAPSLAQGENRYFAGVVHKDERIYMILDIDAVLSSREKSTLAGLDGGGG